MCFDKCQFIHSYLDIHFKEVEYSILYCYYCQEVLNIQNNTPKENILIFDEFDNLEIEFN